LSRELTAAVQTAVENANVPMVAFVELDFGSGFLRVTNAPHTMTWNGHSWLGLGTLGGIDAVDEGTGLEARGVSLKLSGVPVSGEGDSENISIALGEHYQGRDCRIWVALLDEQFSIVPDPKLIFLGRMDNMEIEIGDTATIIVHAENRLADLERPRVRRYNNEDQQAEYSGDRGLEFVEQMVEKAIVWGRTF
jgi:hypothetical protein